MEQRFYARCPPEQRPRVPSQNIKDVEDLGTPTIIEAPEDTKAPGDIDSEKGTESKNDVEDPKENKKYDSSLLKALHSTFFWSWWGSGLLKLVSGSFSHD